LADCGLQLIAQYSIRPIIRFQNRMPVVVGIPTCSTVLDNRRVHATSSRYAEALAGGADVLPILIPPMGQMQMALLDCIDGLLVPGSESNVHPSLYGKDESLTPDLHDPARDATTLPLLHAAAEAGIPILAICRGIQELNVALGGTLHQNVHNKPDRYDHRGDDGHRSDRNFSPRHTIRVTGLLAQIIGSPEIMVNSLHSQAIDRLAPGLVVNAVAEDGTIEAVSGRDNRDFLLGMQWHPEWRYHEVPASRAIFRSFGQACRDRWNQRHGVGGGRRCPMAISAAG
jgi:putative glutamine amidotransferase